MKISRITSAFALMIAAAAMGSTASAHFTQVGWKSDSTTGAVTFYGASYHSLSESGTGGLTLNGTNVAYQSQQVISNADWETLRNSLEYTGHQFSSGIQRMGTIVLSYNDMIGLGFSDGANSFTVNGYGNNVVWRAWSNNNLQGSLTLYNPVPEPTSVAMWGLGAVGACVYARRRRRRQA